MFLYISVQIQKLNYSIDVNKTVHYLNKTDDDFNVTVDDFNNTDWNKTICTHGPFSQECEYHAPLMW